MYFIPLSNVSIVDFEQVNVSWGSTSCEYFSHHFTMAEPSWRENNEYSRTVWEICSKLTTKTPVSLLLSDYIVIVLVIVIALVSLLLSYY